MSSPLTAMIRSADDRFLFLSSCGWSSNELAALKKAISAAQAKGESEAELAKPAQRLLDRALSWDGQWTAQTRYGHCFAGSLLLPMASAVASDATFIVENCSQADFANIVSEARAATEERKKAVASLKKAGIALDLPSPFTDALKRLGVDYTFEIRSALTKLATAKAFAAFFPDDNGYYSAQAGARYCTDAPLARASTFETAKDARSSVRRRGEQLASYLIVEVETRAKAVAENDHKTSLGELGEAMSLAEAQALEDALESAEIDRLRQRLAQLEARVGETPAPAKRRSGAL